LCTVDNFFGWRQFPHPELLLRAFTHGFSSAVGGAACKRYDALADVEDTVSSQVVRTTIEPARYDGYRGGRKYYHRTATALTASIPVKRTRLNCHFLSRIRPDRPASELSGSIEIESTSKSCHDTISRPNRTAADHSSVLLKGTRVNGGGPAI
jgi:hypothetical protein